MTIPLPTSGQVTVTTAGTAVQLPGTDTTGYGNNWYIKALPTNVGNVAIGNIGDDITMATGFVMAPGDAHQINRPSMAYDWLDADNDGDGIAWHKPGQF